MLRLLTKTLESLRADGFGPTLAKAVRYLSSRGRKVARSRPSTPRRKAPPVPSFASWLGRYQSVRPRRLEATPLITVIVPVYDTDPEMLRRCIESVTNQTYDNWELLLVDDASSDPETLAVLAEAASLDQVSVVTNEENLGIAGSTNRGIEAAAGDYLVFLDHDDELATTALEWCASCAPEADLIYSDEYKVDSQGRRSSPFFKPSWSPRLLLGLNYVNHLTCVRTSIARQVGGIRSGFDGAQDHDFLLRLSELPITVAHIPHLLYRWRAWSGSVAGAAGSKVEAEAAGLRALQEAIHRRGWEAEAKLGNGSPFNYRVVWSEQSQRPFVKVIVPTRNRSKLLRTVLDGVFNRTDGVDVHVVVVDNGSDRPKTLALLDELRERDDVTVVRHDDAFNYSVLVNLGARTGPDAPYLLLLNNDIEIHHRGWLQQLTGWMTDPEVAAVGTKLLFPNGRIQHAGVVIGLGGVAGHYALGQWQRPKLGVLHDQAREVDCATAACLLIRTDAFEKVGGFNEDLPIDFQDVDFCLRLREHLDATIMYDPTYPLTHAQGSTRGNTGASNPYTLARMHFVWGDRLRHDPFYNPHLTLWDHSMKLKELPKSDAEAQQRLRPRWSGPRSA